MSSFYRDGDLRRTFLSEMYGVSRDLCPGCFAQRLTRVGVQVEVREVAPGDVQAYPVPDGKTVARRVARDLDRVDHTRLHHDCTRSLGTVATSYDSVSDVDRRSIRIFIDQLDCEVRVGCR